MPSGRVTIAADERVRIAAITMTTVNATAITTPGGDGIGNDDVHY